MSFFAGFFFGTTIVLANIFVIKHFLGKDDFWSNKK
jgi:uncharacterized membrane protein